MNSKYLCLLIILFVTLNTGLGLLTGITSDTYTFQTINNQEIEIFGSGLYANESLFKAAINKGTDLIMLCLVVPLLLFNIFKPVTFKRSIIRLGLLITILYQSMTLSFGAHYNYLFLSYLITFSLTFFTILILIQEAKKILPQEFDPKYPFRFNTVFLTLAGLSVCVWFAEIIPALMTRQPLNIIAHSTTEPTFIIDLGLIAPFAFISVYLLIKRNTLGLISSLPLIILNAFIGIMVVTQSISQNIYGVSNTLIESLLYALPFTIMSGIAIYLLHKNFKHISERI